jgi:hypothetical protein
LSKQGQTLKYIDNSSYSAIETYKTKNMETRKHYKKNGGIEKL